MKQIHLYSCFLSSIKTKDVTSEKKLAQEFLSTASSSYESVTIDSVRRVFKELPEAEQYRIKNYEYLQDRLEGENIPFNPKWLVSGYFMWKPIMIISALQRIPEDSFLVYHDLNIKKYSQYAKNISTDPLELVSLLNGKRSILAFRQYGKYVRMDIKNKIVCDFSLQPNHLGFWAGCLILKNNSYSREFISQWADLCTEENTLPIPEKKQRIPQTDFGGHSADQALLTALVFLKKDEDIVAIKTINERDIHDKRPFLTRLINKTKKIASRAMFYLKKDRF